MGEDPQADIQAFIDRWHVSSAAERANYQLFLAELCDDLDEVQAQQKTLIDVGTTTETKPALVEKQNWPKALKDRATAVRAVLAAFDGLVGVDEVKGRKTQKRKDEVEGIGAD